MKKILQRHRLSSVIFILILLTLLGLDIGIARRQSLSNGRWCLESEFDGLSKNVMTRVAIVRSDDTTLPNPTSLDDSNITYAQIEDMTRRAIELSGGLQGRIKSGDMVLIKPNIVNNEKSGLGGITDVRVVKAVVRLVNEIAPGELDIVIAEASPRPMDYEIEYQKKYTSPCWEKLWDVAGYYDLPTDPDLDGINLRLENMNGPWEDLVYTDIPGGGYAGANSGKMWIDKILLEADFHITVPVMKIHSPGITVALKNNIGLYPSTKYGFPKSEGTSKDNYTKGLWHDEYPQDWIAEEIVDAALVGGIDFVVVDALACLEKSKGPRISGGIVTNQVRRNMIFAGSDMVAIDHVSARLMGLNPDDIAHIALAEKAGLGINDPDLIEIVGSTIEESSVRFEKTTSALGHFGTSNRTWLLCGPFDTDNIDNPIEHEFLENEASVIPEAGKDEWSEPIYFFDERIDLGAFYGVTDNPVAVYAFAYFDSPETRNTVFWLGSDEAMRIYLNGENVYNYDGKRSYDSNVLVKSKIPVQIKEGENTLLIKLYQQSGYFQFALNITEPETDTRYDGNKVLGLKYRTKPAGQTAVETDEQSVLPEHLSLGQNYPNPFNSNTVIPYELPASAHREHVMIAVYNLQGQRIRSLVDRQMDSGHHVTVWDGRDDTGRITASGIYVSQLTWNGHEQVGKMTFVR